MGKGKRSNVDSKTKQYEINGKIRNKLNKKEGKR